MVYKKIFVLAPPYFKTGGTELLHQLVYVLNKVSVEAYIVYEGLSEKDPGKINPEFKKYVYNYKLLSEIEDIKDNAVVVPETMTSLLRGCSKITKIVWWESVDNYLLHDSMKLILNNLVHLNLKQCLIILRSKILRKYKKLNFNELRIIDKHLIQSYYAGDFLEKHKINNYIYLSDYINEIYPIKSEEVDITKKENIVCYNPKKGYKFTKKIISRMPNVKFIPIENMTNDEVVSLLQRSKLYIDFGNHPGKDRFPREAASQYCCVITNKKGSANFYGDVPIPDNYKFEDKAKNLDKIAEMINKCLEYYQECITDFSYYRNFIMGEKVKFVEDVKTIFTETS